MKILIVAAHTDDEAIGCGGTIARHVAEGDIVDIVYMADGVTSRSQNDDFGFKKRQEAAEKAQAVLGLNSVYYLGLPDNKMDGLALLDVVQPLEKIIKATSPEVIYTHHYGDLNVDHQIAHKAVMTACRPQPGSNIREIYSFEIMSSTEWNSPGVHPFLPNYYVDISDYLEVKKQAIDAYAIEMREPPHSRSLEHLICLAHHHGYCRGIDAAEAFMLMFYRR